MNAEYMAEKLRLAQIYLDKGETGKAAITILTLAAYVKEKTEPIVAPKP
jgi:hypothetical protein